MGLRAFGEVGVCRALVLARLPRVPPFRVRVQRTLGKSTSRWEVSLQSLSRLIHFTKPARVFLHRSRRSRSRVLPRWAPRPAVPRRAWPLPLRPAPMPPPASLLPAGAKTKTKTRSSSARLGTPDLSTDSRRECAPPGTDTSERGGGGGGRESLAGPSSRLASDKIMCLISTCTGLAANRYARASLH